MVQTPVGNIWGAVGKRLNGSVSLGLLMSGWVKVHEGLGVIVWMDHWTGWNCYLGSFGGWKAGHSCCLGSLDEGFDESMLGFSAEGLDESVWGSLKEGLGESVWGSLDEGWVIFVCLFFWQGEVEACNWGCTDDGAGRGVSFFWYRA